ncbi:hypothetical protein JOC78_002210 [Bacillus ectoiniformans]|nr:hypothetical protein [Bacillus ectoiniformans]MBM7649257.1 hypothetical protein [Bacillus ectoiniformans]
MVFTSTQGQILGDVWRFTPTNVGTNSVTITATDTDGETASATFNVTSRDTSPPNYATGYPKALNVDATTLKIALKTNETGKGYYAVIADGSEAPTADQLKAGQDGSGRTFSIKGNQAVTANVESVASIAGLNDNTNYDIYVAIEDQYGNLQQTVSKLDVKTLQLPSITSKSIGNFDYSTIYAGQARLTSKVVNSSNFSGNEKRFTVSDGKITVNVHLWWNIPLNQYVTTPAQAVGSAIESEIQQYYNDRNISLYERTMSAFGYGDTLTISTFKTGASNMVTVGGQDWSYFFNQNTAYGADENRSANKSFTVSDGVNTAEITLDWNYSNMDGLIGRINHQLSSQNVNATAVKVSESQFKIVGKSASVSLTINGTNKGDFFN